ncbi:MAG: hypothetical protein DMG96_30485 [Acidobacteria bacterium]|nr:MAG: hypothetical protein DMG96_30485 [Acidobacteriota bacterium]
MKRRTKRVMKPKPKSSTRRTRSQRASRKVSSTQRSPRYSSLTAREKATRERSLALLSDLRGGKGPYTELLRKHHLDTRTAHKYLGQDLLGGTGGKRVCPSKADRRVRELLFPMSSCDLPILTRSSQDATKLSEFFHDRDKLLRGKLSADNFEAKWRGVRIAGQELFTDTATIFLRADAGDLKVENLYASAGGAE